MSSTAVAQSFQYRNLNGVATVPWILDATADRTTLGSPTLTTLRTGEFPEDPFGTDAFSPGTYERPSNWPTLSATRIAANLRREFRFVGGPYVRNATIWFDRFVMDQTLVGGPGTHDYVQYHWRVTSPSVVQLTSPPPNPVAVTIQLPGDANANLMVPGALFTVRTGPDIAATSPAGAPDRESWGARTSDIVIEGNGTYYTSWPPPSINYYDNVVGILQGTDDVVDMTFPVLTSTHPQTTAVWVDPNVSLAGTIEVWSRCGTFPTASAFDYHEFINSGKRFDFRSHPSCGSGVARYFSLTNVNQPARAFRMIVGSSLPSRSFTNMNVGVAFNASAAQMSQIRAEFRRVAWMFYGLTGGTHVINSYRFYNNATGCETLTGCAGLFCNVCLDQGTANATPWCETAIDQVTLHLMAMQPGGADSWDAAVHEFSHCFAGQQGYENYANRCDWTGCHCAQGIGPGLVPISIAISLPSWMGVYQFNNFVFSTNNDHRLSAINWDLLRTQQGPNQVACSGTWTPSASATSDWARLDSSDVPIMFTGTRTAPQLRMSAFWNSTALGFPAQLQ